MARRFFDPESPLWKPLGHVGELVMLSLLWTVCAAPLLTMGAATAALYDAAVRSFRRGETDSLSRFWRTLRRELPGSIPSTALWLALSGGGVWLYRRFLDAAAPGDRSVALAAAFVTLLGLLLGLGCWVFPLLSRFTLPFGRLDVTALRLGLGRLPVTAALALGAFGGIYVTVRLWFLPLAILPAGMMLFFSLFLEPIFKRYEEAQGGP